VASYFKQSDKKTLLAQNKRNTNDAGSLKSRLKNNDIMTDFS
jgi:hypothetical protein